MIEDLAGKRKYVKQENGILGIYLGGEKVRDYEFYTDDGKSKSIETDSSTIWEGIDYFQPIKDMRVTIFYLENGTIGKITTTQKR